MRRMGFNKVQMQGKKPVLSNKVSRCGSAVEVVDGVARERHTPLLGGAESGEMSKKRRRGAVVKSKRKPKRNAGRSHGSACKM
jgi:hypothetical protein